MWLALNKFLQLCSREDIHRLWILLVTVIATGFLEIAGIASILPFLQLASNPDVLNEYPFLIRVYHSLGLVTPERQIVVTGILVVVLLTLSNTLSAITGWQRQRIAWRFAHSITVKLATAYTRLPYAFFLTRDTAELVKSFVEDINNLIDGVVLAGCQFVSQAIIVIMIFILLTIVQPVVAISAVFAFSGIYCLIIIAKRKFFADLGRERLDVNSKRYITFVDLMTGIKAIKSNGAEAYFVERFEHPSKRFSEIQPILYFASYVPRYLVETIGFGAVIAIIVYLNLKGSNLVDVLPTLTLFSLAGYRLLPAVNQCYVAAVQMLSSYAAIDNIHRDLSHQNTDFLQIADNRKTVPVDSYRSVDHPIDDRKLIFSKSIDLADVSFQYGGAEKQALKDIHLTVQKGKSVGVVGPSGSGKTTLIEIITSVLVPDHGSMTVDGVPVDSATMHSWRQQIGYVPQDVFLYNDTIEKNIAFGSHSVDQEKLRTACDIAQLSSFIDTELPDKYATMIGEHGVRLSGGQRQRIGVARAIYRQPDVLVLDEATSALDRFTESELIRAIRLRLPEVTSLIIAHRLSTVENCDWLYVLDKGCLVAEGTFNNLMNESATFRKLANA